MSDDAVRNLPFPRSYWVEPGMLMAGYLPADLDEAETEKRCRALLACGVTRIIDLTEEGEVNPYAAVLSDAAADAGLPVRHIRMAIRDMDVPDVGTMTRILDAIDEGTIAGDVVYVHCWGGRGRTGTVVGCWFVRHGMSGPDALERIASLRQNVPDRSYASPETVDQRAMVRDWRPGS